MADWYISSAAWTAIPQFAASGVYTVGNIVRPLTAPVFNAQYAFRCTTAGTASTEPVWPANNNATVTTGGATFTNVSGQATYGWAAAAGNLYAMGADGAGTGRFTVGDRAFLSSDHSESSASANYRLTITQGYSVIQVLSVNRAGSVPPAAADALSGAAITYSGAGTMGLDCYVNMYWQGIRFTLGGSGSALLLSNVGVKSHYFRSCAIVFTTSNTSATITIGNGGVFATLDNTPVTFNNALQRFLQSGNLPVEIRWINTPAATLGSVPSNLFAPGNVPFLVTFRGVDLSAVTTTLFSGDTSSGAMKGLLDSCWIAPGVVRFTASAFALTNDEVELVNCYDGTHFVAERHTPAGDLTTEFSTTMVGGATDNAGLFSHKMVSSARSDPWAMTLDSFWLDVNNAVTGASHTATVELIASSALNNNDVRLILEYQGTAGSSLATFGESASALTAVAALPTSPAVTWNSPPATPVKQHLSVTFTAQTAGRLRGLVRLGKPSTTLWINPQITIT